MYDEELALKKNLIPDFRPKYIKHWIRYKNYYIGGFFAICLCIMITLIIWCIIMDLITPNFKQKYYYRYY